MVVRCQHIPTPFRPPGFSAPVLYKYKYTSIQIKTQIQKYKYRSGFVRLFCTTYIWTLYQPYHRGRQGNFRCNVTKSNVFAHAHRTKMKILFNMSQLLHSSALSLWICMDLIGTHKTLAYLNGLYWSWLRFWLIPAETTCLRTKVKSFH